MFRFVSPLFLCLSALLALSCSVDSASLPDCHPLFPECGDEDADGDGVVNRDDDFPTDASCSVRDQNNCTGCGRGCGEDEWCSDSYTCRAVEDEVCNGEDEDGDGRIDEAVTDAPFAQAEGVCGTARQPCVEGRYVNPDFSAIEGYVADNDPPCDGVDNDCDGRVDEGTADPEVCDGVDNDCDGTTDEDVDLATAPLADLQAGVCEGAKRVCEAGVGWVEPMYSDATGYGAETCDGVDNDCDGSTDEDAGEPEVCDGADNDCDGSTDEGVLNACGECGAVPAEVCDGADNDCDGSTDEELDAPLTENQVGVCEGALQSCVSGDWVSDYSGVSDYSDDFGGVLSDRLDNDCDGVVDEEPPPPCEPNCPDLDFVRIEGGSFMMGDQRSSVDVNEIPVHNVNVPTFEMMRTEITVAQYRVCVNASVCSTPNTGEYFTWSSNPSDQEDHPINGVSWNQLMEFAAWVGARLPTEAEWEYAASSRIGATYPWGESSPTCNLANYSGCEGSTSSVCSRSAGNTEQGLCDMAGNVYEWVQDEAHINYIGAPGDGSGWCPRGCPANASDPSYNASYSADRIFRGGGWGDSAARLRAAGRYDSHPRSLITVIGGRLAKTVR